MIYLVLIFSLFNMMLAYYLGKKEVIKEIKEIKNEKAINNIDDLYDVLQKGSF